MEIKENQLAVNWQSFVHKGQLNQPAVNPLIAASWQRSAELGVSPFQLQRNDILEAHVLRQRQQASERLLQAATGPMESVYFTLRGMGFTVVLTDPDGYILQAIGDPEFLDKANQVSLTPGANWSENIKGTNAIGTAINLMMPVKVHAWEHYCQDNHIITCSAAPIIDPQGYLLGTLDVTGDYRDVNDRLIYLVTLAAKNIEKEILLQDLLGKHRMSQRDQSIILMPRKSLPEKAVGQYYSFDNIVGESEGMQKAIKTARRSADSMSTILITGETGTGKELFAQSIHQASQRANGPFMAINCAAIPGNLVESELFGYEAGAFTGAKKSGQPGKFELAERGTIFLDEIGDMPLAAQSALLRVLQEKKITRIGGHKVIPIDVRVIAATHKDLEQAVENGSFRQDLFYRLNVVNISIPPLRERKDDILKLAGYFLDKHIAKLGRKSLTMSPQARLCLLGYDWPGNIREIENTMEGVANMLEGDYLLPEHLPDRLGKQQSRENVDSNRQVTTLREMEKQAIIRALSSCQGNITLAAQVLDIGRNTLHRKIKEYEIVYSQNN